jgi:hypothetical protein
MNSRVVDFHFFHFSGIDRFSLEDATLDGADDSRIHARQDKTAYFPPVRPCPKSVPLTALCDDGGVCM